MYFIFDPDCLFQKVQAFLGDVIQYDNADRSGVGYF
jgi:hypothetical protein